MDVVPQAGSIRGGIVRPEDGHTVPLSQRRLDDPEGSDGSPAGGLLRCSPKETHRSSVEVPQSHIAKAIGLAVVFHHLFDHQLGRPYTLVGCRGISSVMGTCSRFPRIPQPWKRTPAVPHSQLPAWHPAGPGSLPRCCSSIFPGSPWIRPPGCWPQSGAPVDLIFPQHMLQEVEIVDVPFGSSCTFSDMASIWPVLKLSYTMGVYPLAVSSSTTWEPI